MSRGWKFFLVVSLLAGILLRTVWVQDMEYKEDEEYNYSQTQLYHGPLGGITDWPVSGIPSGVYLKNPGMSVWVFVALAKISGAKTPTQLATAVQVFALLGICLLIPFVTRFLKSEEREPWLWAFALAMVNPFAVLYQRKLWPEPFLPFFTMLTLMGWWRRDRWTWAFLWGMVGAWLGQIHMSGFFFSAGLFLWTLLFGGKRRLCTHWRGWFAGSVVGALPLIPWAIDVLKHPHTGHMSASLSEILQLKYWVFWITNPIGLHLGNPLGLMRGPSHWHQISDFVRYPLVAGTPTFLVGAAHFVAALAAVWILGAGLKQLATLLPHPRRLFSSLIRLGIRLGIGSGSDTAFAQNAAFWGCGILLTLTGVMIRRYYLMVVFPLDFVWLARMAPASKPLRTRLLGALWIAQLVMSAGFVIYVHQNQGSVQGDYGEAYHVILKKRGANIRPN